VIRTVLVLGIAVTLTAGCGLRGDLVRPVPMWGNPPNEGPLDPRTIKAVEEAAAAEKARQDADRKAADETRRRELEQQATPPATPQQ
jgi:Prokaryotic lipoprotein-attachment site